VSSTLSLPPLVRQQTHLEHLWPLLQLRLAQVHPVRAHAVLQRRVVRQAHVSIACPPVPAAEPPSERPVLPELPHPQVVFPVRRRLHLVLGETTPPCRASRSRSATRPPTVDSGSAETSTRKPGARRKIRLCRFSPSHHTYSAPRHAPAKPHSAASATIPPTALSLRHPLSRPFRFPLRTPP